MGATAQHHHCPECERNALAAAFYRECLTIANDRAARAERQLSRLRAHARNTRGLDRPTEGNQSVKSDSRNVKRPKSHLPPCVACLYRLGWGIKRIALACRQHRQSDTAAEHQPTLTMPTSKPDNENAPASRTDKAVVCDALVLPPILCDCKGREIMLGDTLKVFHFTGARRNKYWMYKHVVERVMLGTANPRPAFKLSHLNLRPESYYWELIDGRHLEGVEIVQGYGTDGTPFDDRPKHSKQNTADEPRLRTKKDEP